LIFHPDGKSAYLINELNSTLIGFRYDPQDGTFEELQTVPALPREFRGENLCADIHITPDGNIYTRPIAATIASSAFL
jgi:6-phosphogluconolactonase